MASTPKPSMIADINWNMLQVKCPVCNKSFRSWYCPTCGLPKNNSSYEILDDVPYSCGGNHFREEFPVNNNYQLCSKCYTPNPYHANFCRKCGRDITTQAIDIGGHEWVDLGLSVLWSTKSLEGLFRWNDNNIFDHPYCGTSERDCNPNPVTDIATYRWGNKWRTPTKAEFEELINKCYIENENIPYSNDCAVKFVGPNGNHILIPLVADIGFHDRKLSLHYEYWTSTKGVDDKKNIRGYTYAYADSFDASTFDTLSFLWGMTLHDESKHSFRLRTINPRRFVASIRPVADKIWQGEL